MMFVQAARRLFVAAALLLSLLSHAAAQVSDSTVLTPLPLPGPYPVGCSNVTQDFSRVAPGEDVQAYWEGLPRRQRHPPDDRQPGCRTRRIRSA
jgi:hypothetical protein